MRVRRHELSPSAAEITPSSPAETYFLDPRLPGDMASVDPFIVLIVGALLALILFFYLMLRRTLLGFKEGMDDGRR
jgi:hypothetical protein